MKFVIIVFALCIAAAVAAPQDDEIIDRDGKAVKNS